MQGGFTVNCLLRNRLRYDSRLFFNPQIRQDIRKYLFYDWRGDSAAVINPLRVIDNGQSQYLRILCRRKAQEGGNIFIGAPGQGLGGSCLPADGKTFDKRLVSAPLGDNFFQDSAHCLGCLAAYNPFLKRIFQRFHQFALPILDGNAKMGRNPGSPIDQRRHRCGQLDRRDLERLAK